VNKYEMKRQYSGDCCDSANRPSKA